MLKSNGRLRNVEDNPGRNRSRFHPVWVLFTRLGEATTPISYRLITSFESESGLSRHQSHHPTVDGTVPCVLAPTEPPLAWHRSKEHFLLQTPSSPGPSDGALRIGSLYALNGPRHL
jgi:hypothetical protein